MALNFNFLNTGNEDWNEPNWHKVALLLQGLDGILEGYLSEFAVIQNTPPAMNVKVGTGMGWANGIEFDNTAVATVTVTPADATYSRKDLVVVAIDWVAKTVTLTTHDGEAAASPVAPDPTQNSSLYEYPLAVLTIPAGQAGAAVTTAMIADARTFLNGAIISCAPDGGGKVIATGVKGRGIVLCDCTIASWDIMASPLGSAVFDIKKLTYASPTSAPTAVSICASDKPTISSAYQASGSSLTGWTTSLKRGDRLEFTVDSCTGLTLATLTLRCVRGIVV